MLKLTLKVTIIATLTLILITLSKIELRKKVPGGFQPQPYWSQRPLASMLPTLPLQQLAIVTIFAVTTRLLIFLFFSFVIFIFQVLLSN